MKRGLSLLAGAAAIGFACVAYSYLTLPDVRSLATTEPETTAFMDLRDRETRDKGRQPRRIHKWVPYNRISPHLKKAVLVAEDAAFWDHDGVDYVELQKSIETDWARGQLSRGASTITQQLAKNLYLSPSKNPVRKLRELIIARRLEGALKKARILELYLNLIEWGDGIYGVEAAAREYFGTTAAALGPSEAALLAGAIINPRVLTPSRPTARLLRRQQIILSRMGRVVAPAEHVNGRELEKATLEPLETAPPPVPAAPVSKPEERHPDPAGTSSEAVDSAPLDEVLRPTPPEGRVSEPLESVPSHPKLSFENSAAQLDSLIPTSA